ncbi:MAG: ABC transporter permease [Bacillota bacterium]
MGRDILTRIVYGARLSLLISGAAVATSVVGGVPVGLISGYYGGWVDSLVQRAVDILLAFPGFLLALVFIAILGPGEANVVAAVGLAGVAVYVRLVRGVVLVVREDLYVEAARAMGLPDRLVVWRHVLPNAVMPVVVQSSLQLGTALLTAAGLGYLGLGVKPPTPEWGAMIGEAQSYVFSAWWMSAFPGLAIFLTVMAFNLIGDGLRDSLDPRTSLG